MTNANLFKVGLKLLAILFIILSLQTLINGIEALYIRLFLVGRDNFLMAGMTPSYMPDVLMIFRGVVIIVLGFYVVLGNIDWMVKVKNLSIRLTHNSKQ